MLEMGFSQPVHSARARARRGAAHRHVSQHPTVNGTAAGHIHDTQTRFSWRFGNSLHFRGVRMEIRCPPSFIDPITTEIMRDPVTLKDTGHT